MKAISVIILCATAILCGCSTDPKSGKLQDKSQPVHFEMYVLDVLPELWVRWQAANVDSAGNVVNWQDISFITRANSSAPFSIGPDTYRSYSDDQYIFNWTRANTGYTGGCGNVPDSCPEHALIRAQIGYSNGPGPAVVFRESGGLICIANNVLSGWVSVVSNCQKPGANGIVPIFSGD